jgi:hypothetical protein
LSGGLSRRAQLNGVSYRKMVGSGLGIYQLGILYQQFYKELIKVEWAKSMKWASVLVRHYFEDVKPMAVRA